MPASQEPRPQRPPRRRFWGPAAACCLLAFAFGLAKLVLQSRHPPAWAAIGDNSYDGFVAIDGFAHRAALLRDLLAGHGDGGALLASLRAGLHPTTLVGPLLTAVIALSGLPIPYSYVLATWIAFAASLGFAVRLARSLQRTPTDSASTVSLPVVVLLATHCLSLRTVGQLYQDWFVACACLGAAHRSLLWCRLGGVGAFVAAAAWLVLGAFTKLSFAPALLLPVALAIGGHAGSRRVLAALALAGLPLVATLLFALALGSPAILTQDPEHILATNAMSAGRLGAFALETVLLLQAFPLLLWRHRRQLTGEAKALLVCAGVAFAATAGFKLPVIPRLYLPILALLVPVLMATAPHACTRRRLWAATLLNGALGAVGLASQ